jgi:hypothetical protein
LISVRHVPEYTRPDDPRPVTTRALHAPVQLRGVFVAAQVPESTIWLDALTRDHDPFAVLGALATGWADQVP